MTEDRCTSSKVDGGFCKRKISNRRRGKKEGDGHDDKEYMRK